MIGIIVGVIFVITWIPLTLVQHHNDYKHMKEYCDQQRIIMVDRNLNEKSQEVENYLSDCKKFIKPE